MPKFTFNFPWFKRHSEMNFAEVNIEAGREEETEDENAITTVATTPSNTDLLCGFERVSASHSFKYFATLKWFLVFICLSVMIQGCAQVYFNRTAFIWKHQYGFSEQMAQWLLVGNFIFNGVFAIFMVHASITNHRMVWVASSMTMFAVTCFALWIPEFFQVVPNDDVASLKQKFESKQLCTIISNMSGDIFPDATQPSWVAFSLMILFQAALSCSFVLVFVNGVIYIDDHESIDDAIMLNGVFLAFKQLGPHLGSMFTWLSVMSEGVHVFATPVWTIIALVICALGLCLGMYPKFLTEEIRIKSIVCNTDALHHKKDLCSFLGRILRNHIVILNMLTSMFFWSGIYNYSLVENNLSMSKFAFPDETIYLNPVDFQVIISVVTPITVFITIIFTASIISKFNLRAFNVSIWIGVVPALLIVFFLVYIFLGCDYPGLTDGTTKILESYCNWNCSCERSLYEPVCIPEVHKTFFSPCYAGCTGYRYEEDQLIYTNCTCSTPLNVPFTAYPGLCSMSACYPEWLSQDLVQLGVATLSSTVLVCQITVTLYCVHFSERGYALALHIAGIGLLGLGPIRSAYKSLSDAACRFFSPTGFCRLHDPVPLTRYIITFTIILLFLSSITGLVMAICIRRQIACSPDFLIGIPQRIRRRNRTSSFVSLGPLDLERRRIEEPAEETPLVLVQIHHHPKVNNNSANSNIEERIHNIFEPNETRILIESASPIIVEDIPQVQVNFSSEVAPILEETSF